MLWSPNFTPFQIESNNFDLNETELVESNLCSITQNYFFEESLLMSLLFSLIVSAGIE